MVLFFWGGHPLLVLALATGVIASLVVYIYGNQRFYIIIHLTFQIFQTFVGGSSLNSEVGYPFGYLKAATNLQAVNLFVLPYNYPVVMPLLGK